MVKYNHQTITITINKLILYHILAHVSTKYYLIMLLHTYHWMFIEES